MVFTPLNGFHDPNQTFYVTATENYRANIDDAPSVVVFVYCTYTHIRKVLFNLVVANGGKVG